MLSFQGGITIPAYTASKHGIAGITKALANEWAPLAININSIAPGYISTENTRPLRENETRNRQILERIPQGGWGEPEHIAGTCDVPRVEGRRLSQRRCHQRRRWLAGAMISFVTWARLAMFF
jgi:NAD(P)-dependent dehydrogenase (short-subunit alcohol dehydrogenase family)